MTQRISSKNKLFTEAEAQAIERRLNKDYTDPHGLFAGRVRPKLKELLDLTDTAKKRATLKKILIKQGKDDKPARPNDESTLNEFAKEVGY
jgi:hypothetical protein